MREDGVVAFLHSIVKPAVFRKIMGTRSAQDRNGNLENHVDPQELEAYERIGGLKAGTLDPNAIRDLGARLREEKVTVLSFLDERYPPSLSTLPEPPAVLYVKGDVNRLAMRGLGICGSRNASRKGNAMAWEFGRLVADLGANEVSGYAKGVDTNAHLGALENGGETIVVLAEGVLHFRLKRLFGSIKNVVQKMTVVSEFHPNQRWMVSAAMQRNKTICGLSLGLVVVEARESGGTLNAGKECLKQKKPLFVTQYGNQSDMPKGNSYLIRAGGIPIGTMAAMKRELKSFWKSSEQQEEFSSKERQLSFTDTGSSR